MPNSLIFSMSQLKTYIECRKKYQLGYEMNLEPQQGDGPMSRGTEFHKWAEYLTSSKWDNLVSVAEPEASLETIAVYNAWWVHRGKEKHDKKKRVLGVEQSIYTPLDVHTGIPGQQVYLRCTFDEIYLDKEGWIVGFDYKTFAKLMPWDVDLDFQGRLYIAALQKLFPTYSVRFEYERIRQSAPGTPRGAAAGLRLEEGTWWIYNAAGNKRKRAEVWTPEECYETIDLVVPQTELDELWEETLFNVTELLVRRKVAETMPGAWGRQTNKFTCGMCYYKDLCKSDLQGTLDEGTIAILATRREPLEIPEELKEETNEATDQS
jgi:hypothetical protein